MKYNFIKTDDVIDAILKSNNITKKELEVEDSFVINDKAILNFKKELDNSKNLKFLIVGDFDCDGICATTIIKKILDYLNIENNYYIPSRLKEGYGINDDIVNRAIEYKFDAIFMVDNGIASLDQIDLAIKNNIKVFIIDHHEYLTLPNAYIIHNKLVEDKYADLSAAGLCYLLSKTYYDDELSLVLGGLSTLSDMMPVLNFNRCLINKMFKCINHINQMLMLNDNKSISYDDIIYNIIPKINAISRMEPMSNPNYLVKYFLDNEYSKEYINTINYINEQRKLCTKDMSLLSKNLINENNKIILIHDISFKEGLCGLIANRILSEYHKPTIVLAENEGLYKGSARGPKNINMFELFKEFNHYSSFGGHQGAIGLSFEKEYLNDFEKYINNLDIEINEEIKDVLLIDETLIDDNLLNEIEDLKPFGENFILPLIGIQNKNYNSYLIKGMYPKYQITKNISAISFNSNHKFIEPVYIIGTLKKDNYKRDSISLLIEDLI